MAASERITVGGIGINARGAYVLGALLSLPDTQFVAICDVRADRRKAVKKMADTQVRQPGTARPIGIFVSCSHDRTSTPYSLPRATAGTPWPSVMAAKAGKDVYVEKPCSMSMAESRILAETMRRYGRVFQVGTQRRTISNFKFAVDLAHSGKLGKLQTLHASLAFYGGGPERRAGSPRLASGKNRSRPRKNWIGRCGWDRLRGGRTIPPTQTGPSCGGWLSYFDFNAGGGLLNWASHTVDLCQWANQSDGTTPGRV